MPSTKISNPSYSVPISLHFFLQSSEHSSMYPNPPSPKCSAENTSIHALRHLPTYEEVNIPYSLRLPTYRSSYIRRFHPYARYTTSSAEDVDSDNSDYYDEDTLLDLTILDEYAPQQPEVPLLVSANEIHAISTHNQAVEMEELSETEASLTDLDVHVELEGPRGAFLRIDTIAPLHSTESLLLSGS